MELVWLWVARQLWTSNNQSSWSVLHRLICYWVNEHWEMNVTCRKAEHLQSGRSGPPRGRTVDGSGSCRKLCCAVQYSTLRAPRR